MKGSVGVERLVTDAVSAKRLSIASADHCLRTRAIVLRLTDLPSPSTLLATSDSPAL